MLWQHQTPFLLPTRCIQQPVKSHLGVVLRPPSSLGLVHLTLRFPTGDLPHVPTAIFLLFLVTLTLPAPFGQCLFSGACNFPFQSLRGASVESTVREV